MRRNASLTLPVAVLALGVAARAKQHLARQTAGVRAATVAVAFTLLLVPSVGLHQLADQLFPTGPVTRPPLRPPNTSVQVSTVT